MNKGLWLLTSVITSVLMNIAVKAAFIDFGPGLPGAPVDVSVVLTDQLASYGIIFSTTDPEGVHWNGPGYAWDEGRYAIAAGTPGGFNEPANVDPIRVDFSTSVVEVSIRGFDGGGDEDTLIMKAFDSSDSLAAMTSITSDFNVPGFIATVSAPEIAYATFAVSTNGHQHGLLFDDLTFISIVPEPSTYVLFATMIVGLGFVGHRKRRTANSPSFSDK